MLKCIHFVMLKWEAEEDLVPEISTLLFIFCNPKVISEILQVLKGIKSIRMWLPNLLPTLCLRSWRFHLPHLSAGTMAWNWVLAADKHPENDRSQECH